MIKGFLICWAVYWAAVAVLPVHSIYPATTEALILQLSFVCLVCLGYLSVAALTPNSQMPVAASHSIPSVRRVIALSLIMSLLGFLFLLFDKIYMQQIDYSNGLAVAREQWRTIGEDRDGKASSIWSALGYLIGSGYYVALVLAITHANQLTSRQRVWVVLASFMFALANSIITGGRSNFLLLVVIAMSSLSARSRLGVASVFSSRKQRRIAVSVLFLTVFYMGFVFFARANAGNQLIYLYVVNFLPYMGLDFDSWYLRSVGESWVGDAGSLTILMIGYLTHSFASVAAIMDAPLEHKVIIFNNFASIFYKLGWIEKPDTDWFLQGRFPSVPGALWHEFGTIGFGLCSLALGFSCAMSRLWTICRPNRLLPLASFVLLGSTLILSPFAFAPDFLSFPFVGTAFVILAVASRLLDWRRSVTSVNAT